MEQWQIYLFVYDHVHCKQNGLTIGDTAKVWCCDPEKKTMIEKITIYSEKDKIEKQVVLSVMVLMNVISEQIKICCQHAEPVYHLSGASSVIVDGISKPQKKWCEAGKIVVTSSIIFVGSAFTIMAYDQDVDVSGIFFRIEQLLTGKADMHGHLLELGYAIGLAIGLLLFFQPFRRRKRNNEPSPLEIEIEKYESDVEDVVRKKHQ